eukprot:scaffold135141_cov107-Phaeocystis_antarctica.AAC.1
MHSAASSAYLTAARHLHLVGLGLAGPVGDTEETRAVLGHAQRQPLRLRLLPCLLARQRRRCCGPLRRRLPLRRARHAQRRLLGDGEVAQVDYLATAAHPRLVGFAFTGLDEGHAEVTRLALGHAQRQPFRLCLLPHLRARQRRRRCSPLRRYRLPLRRSRHAQRRFLGRNEHAQV